MYKNRSLETAYRLLKMHINVESKDKAPLLKPVLQMKCQSSKNPNILCEQHHKPILLFILEMYLTNKRAPLNNQEAIV